MGDGAELSVRFTFPSNTRFVMQVRPLEADLSTTFSRPCAAAARGGGGGGGRGRWSGSAVHVEGEVATASKRRAEVEFHAFVLQQLPVPPTASQGCFGSVRTRRSRAGQSVSSTPDREAALQFRHQVGGLEKWKRARRDEQAVGPSYPDRAL